jgi:hypothetical protein
VKQYLRVYQGEDSPEPPAREVPVFLKEFRRKLSLWVYSDNASSRNLAEGVQSKRMDLEGFIKASLSQITSAVVDFSLESKGTATAVPNFKDFDSEHMARVGIVRVAQKLRQRLVDDVPVESVLLATKFATIIQFDVAVTAASSAEAGVKASLNVMGADLRTGGKANSENSAVSRIQFSIPLQIERSAAGQTESEDAELARLQQSASSATTMSVANTVSTGSYMPVSGSTTDYANTSVARASWVSHTGPAAETPSRKKREKE